jgi:hypothetical protein
MGIRFQKRIKIAPGIRLQPEQKRAEEFDGIWR